MSVWSMRFSVGVKQFAGNDLPEEFKEWRLCGDENENETGSWNIFEFNALSDCKLIQNFRLIISSSITIRDSRITP